MTASNREDVFERVNAARFQQELVENTCFTCLSHVRILENVSD